MPLPPETHAFKVTGNVRYRCYAGNDGKKVFDSMTKAPCDSKDYKSTVIDKIVTVTIKDEPDPEDSKELEGSWGETFEFKGRKFTVAISLFKMPPPAKYRLRLVATDNEPNSRSVAVFTEVKDIDKMNQVSIDHSSAGTKEAISFWVDFNSAQAEH